ncbi:hypothetical protein Trydic_g18255 [Trypoxylus dichotomus]
MGGLSHQPGHENNQIQVSLTLIFRTIRKGKDGIERFDGVAQSNAVSLTKSIVKRRSAANELICHRRTDEIMAGLRHT